MTHALERAPSSAAASQDLPQILPASRLVRHIGKDPADWTVDDLIDVVVRMRIRLVSLMHIGGDGWLKTLDFVPRDLPHLREVLSFGERADGSSLFGMMGVSVTASDVVLRAAAVDRVRRSAGDAPDARGAVRALRPRWPAAA